MTTQTQANGPVNSIMLGAGVLFVVALGLALSSLMSGGHAEFNTTSHGVAWGLAVVNYVFFTLTSFGLTVVASMALVFGTKAFYPIAKRCIWLSLAALIAGFASLAMELGHPFRMLWALPLSARFSSPLVWMGLFYAGFIVITVMKFQKLSAGDWDSAGSRKLGVGALVFEAAAVVTLGLAFGMMAMRPDWYGASVPVYFLAAGTTSGVAMAVLITRLTYGSEMPDRIKSLLEGPLSQLFVTALGLFVLVYLARAVTGLWSNVDGLQVWQQHVSSAWFWVAIAGLAGAIYISVTDLRRQGSMQMIAAGLALLAVFIERYQYVIGGQLMPLFKGSWVQGLVDYTPSSTEWMLTLMSFAFVFAAWGVGERIFNIADEPK